LPAFAGPATSDRLNRPIVDGRSAGSRPRTQRATIACVDYLLLHGLDGSGPEHWQTWLAGRLRRRGLEVAYPTLPEPSAPHVAQWLAALDDSLASPAGETTVLCHSLGCLLWLHHAARRQGRVSRALLVAPTQPDEEDPPSVGFRPAPLDPDGIAAAAGETLLVCSTDDPYCPPSTSRRIATELESWALGERDRPV
jgi:predicted alpha/beta hydrolase family esterase